MHIRATTCQNQQWLCAQRRLRSAWACAQSDQSSLSAWRKLGSLATHWAHSEDSGHPPSLIWATHWAHSEDSGHPPRLIWVFAGRTVTFLVLSCRGSYRKTSFFLIDRKCYTSFVYKRPPSTATLDIICFWNSKMSSRKSSSNQMGIYL